MDNSKHIDVILAGRKYPLKVNQEDIEQVNGVVNDLNHKIRNYQLKYGKDLQDCMAMCMLQIALDQDESKRIVDEKENLSKHLALLHKELDKLI